MEAQRKLMSERMKKEYINPTIEVVVIEDLLQGEVIINPGTIKPGQPADAKENNIVFGDDIDSDEPYRDLWEDWFVGFKRAKRGVQEMARLFFSRPRKACISATGGLWTKKRLSVVGKVEVTAR